jgi:hypothetical protein
MSNKAQGLVWDLVCPATFGEQEFKPSHKYVLVAYADHADHLGKNIFPAVPTIAKKTGLDERTVQRLTKDLYGMGLLIEDGVGPRGTNRWRLPYDGRGDKLSPVTNRRGDKSEKSLGDIPSGDIPSGDNLSPELKELNQETINTINQEPDLLWAAVKDFLKEQVKKAQYVTWVEPTEIHRFDGRTLSVSAPNQTACDWLEKNIRDLVQKHLGVYVSFVNASELAGE